MAAAAAARAPAPQDDNCEQDARPWSPSSAEDYSDMPGLINVSPPGPLQPNGEPYAYEPPVLSPVRHFLDAPQRDSSDYPVQMDLDAAADEMPPLLAVDDIGLPNWLGTSIPDPWTTEQPQQQQRHQQQHRQRQRHGADEPSERLRLNVLNSLPQLELRPELRPPRATGVGQRSRPSSSRRTTGPQSARPAWAPAQPAQQDTQDVSARTRRHIDALYATAVQQVWSRTARLSADLLGWNGDDSSGARMQRLQHLQPLPLSRSTQQQQQQQEEQQEREAYVQLQQVQQVPLPAEMCRPPAPCSFLQPGMSFVGNQKLLQRGSLRQEDQWGVQVVLHGVDYQRGRVSGSMRALDVAGAAGPIDTYFEGDIVDDINNSFWTQAWGASRETDMRHWSKFDSFADIKPLVTKHGGRCGKLQQHPAIFMRWKEQFFVNTNEQCGLTIAGFYYVALDRSTGAMRGLYYDPSSSPFQELCLQVDRNSSASGSSSSSSSRRSSSSTADCVDGRLSSGSGRLSSGSGSSGTVGHGISFASYTFA